jgi:hypothetical protein
MTGLPCVTLPNPLDAVIRPLRLAMRSLRLMRRMRMILWLEVLRLVCGTFVINSSHGVTLSDKNAKRLRRTIYGEGLGPINVVPPDPRSKAGDGRCAPGGKGSGLADAQQAIRSTSLSVSGHADCDASGGAGAGLAHAAKRTNETISNARIIARPPSNCGLLGSGFD